MYLFWGVGWGGHTIQPEQVGQSSQVTPERHESHLSGVTYWQAFNTSPSQISPPNPLVLFLWSVIFPQGKKSPHKCPLGTLRPGYKLLLANIFVKS